ncbi:hypothetical protein F11_15965 [Rhodospirillum rubrum F11]|nr:hypothetical protein F11_15965 [Rhodospirillum rubrum F11]
MNAVGGGASRSAGDRQGGAVGGAGHRAKASPRPGLPLVLLSGLGAWAIPPAAAEVDITPSLSLEEAYTDNVYMTESGKEGDLISTGTAAIDLRSLSRRLKASSNYSISQDLYLDHSELNGYQQSFLGVNQATVVEEHFFVDARGALSQQQTSGVGDQTATNRTNPGGGQTQVLNVSLRPYYVQHWDDLVVSTLSYRLNTVQYLSPSSGDSGETPEGSVQHQTSIEVGNGTFFDRTLWAARVEDDRSVGGSKETTSQTYEGRGEYRLTRMVGLLATVGYDSFSDGGDSEDSEETTALYGRSNSDQYSGAFWNAGVHLTPGPRTDLSVRYGQRYNEPWWSGDLTYRLSEALTFRASYGVDVQNQQQNLASRLDAVRFDGDTLDLVDGAGNPADPNRTDSTLVDAVSRTETLRVGLNGVLDRNSFEVQGSYIQRDYGSSSLRPKDNTLQVSGSYRRTLSPLTGAGVRVSYSTRDGEFSGTTSSSSSASSASASKNTLMMSVNMDHKLSDTLRGRVEVSRLERSGGSEVTENAVSLFLKASF